MTSKFFVRQGGGGGSPEVFLHTPFLGCGVSISLHPEDNGHKIVVNSINPNMDSCNGSNYTFVETSSSGCYGRMFLVG